LLNDEADIIKPFESI